MGIFEIFRKKKETDNGAKDFNPYKAKDFLPVKPSEKASMPESTKAFVPEKITRKSGGSSSSRGSSGGTVSTPAKDFLPVKPSEKASMPESTKAFVPKKLKARESTGKPIRYNPVTKKPIIEIEGGRSKFTGQESIVRPTEEIPARTQFQEEFLGRQSLTPRFGTIGFGQGGMVSLGEIQRERELKGMESVPGYYDEPDVRTTGKKILEESPVIGTGISAVGSLREMSGAVQTQRSAEELLGVGAISQKDSLRSIGKAAVETGLFAADVALLGVSAKAGISAGRTSLQKSLAKQISIGAEQLGKAPVISGTVTDIGSGKFAQQFVQKSGKFKRSGLLFGTSQEGVGGLQFVPSGKGIAVASGKAEFTGAKKISAKLFGADTKKIFKQTQKFDIGAVQFGTVEGEAFGFKTSRAVGAGVFTPTKTVTGIGGRSGALIETRVGDTAISTGFKTPSFTKKFPKGDISYFEIRGGKGLQISTDLTKPKPSVISFTKDEAKVARGRAKFFEGLKTPEVKTTSLAPEIKAPVKRNGLISEIKAPTTQKFKTPQVSETLQKGFSRTAYQPKPFQFVKPKIPKSAIGLGTITIGARAFTSGKLKAPTFGQDFRTGQITKTRLINDTSFKLDTERITDTGFKPISPTITTPGTGGFVPKTPTPIIPGFILPSLTVGKAKGVGKISGRFVPDYSQSFAGYTIGAVGKTKGIKIGGREIYTGLEIRGKQKKKSKKKK